ncbi:MAG: hypothetical protein IPM54_34570 [Polyangiaceae bacterium]|nr:hypothetical protein [Polyangiaceae bacterium]
MNSRPYELYISLDALQQSWQATTAWENEAHLRAALVSLELTFLLIEETWRDTRRYVRKRDRIDRLWNSATMQIRLLADVLDNARPPESTFSTSPSHSTNLCVLRTFEHPKRNVRHFVDEYATLLDEVPILLGLEVEIEQFAAAYGLSMPSRCAERLQLPYDTWIQPERIAAIFRRRTFNAEDRFVSPRRTKASNAGCSSFWAHWHLPKRRPKNRIMHRPPWRSKKRPKS